MLIFQRNTWWHSGCWGFSDTVAWIPTPPCHLPLKEAWKTQAVALLNKVYFSQKTKKGEDWCKGSSTYLSAHHQEDVRPQHLYSYKNLLPNAHQSWPLDSQLIPIKACSLTQSDKMRECCIPLGLRVPPIQSCLHALYRHHWRVSKFVGSISLLYSGWRCISNSSQINKISVQDMLVPMREKSLENSEGNKTW